MRKHLLSFFLLVISLVCRAHDGENFVASDLFASLQPGDKAALLMVHFGTTHDDTRALTIDAINQKAKEAFKDVELREAWTSRIVMRRLKARGVEKLNPIEALEKLKTDGYTHVLIQSTNIIEGIEMESLRKDVATMKSSFKEIRIGNPLLYTPEDYEAVIVAITKNGAKEGATLLVGHGTYTPATAQYAMLDYMLKEKGFKDYSVGTIEGYPTFDTMVAHYLLQPEQRHNMDYLADVLLHYKTVDIESLIGTKGKKQQCMRNVPITQICEYAAEDADVTLKLKNVLEPMLKKEGLDKLFYEIEMPLVRVLAEMEITGVNVDKVALQSSSVVLSGQIEKLEKEIYELAGMEFNVSSARQVGEVLFERLKLDEKAKKTKTGQYSTTEDILEKLRSKHPIVGKILELRGIRKLLSTYINALPELINPRTGKIHTSFNQTITATGRLSSSNPNLQNIPIRDEVGKEIRRAFVPDEGSLFFSADYSQIELRIMADLSGDEHMIEAFTSDADIHAATAAKIYKLPIDEVSKDMRRKAKTANFGIIYGISVFGLAERLNIPRSESKQLIEGYFESYPHVKEYMEKSIEIARKNGYVETICGRKRMLPDINSHNSVVRGYAERNAINAPIQGSAADIIKIAMIRIFNRFEKENLKTKMILQVHDELNFNVPENELEQVRNIVREEMENAWTLKVPLIADSGVGNNWLEAH